MLKSFAMADLGVRCVSAFNPYEAPEAGSPSRGGLPETVDLWRDGARLVARHRATFPDRCIRCNDPARGYRLKKTVYWHHPAYYLFLLAFILPYIVVGWLVTRSSRVEAGICPAHRARRRNAIVTGWAIVFAAIALIVAGIRIEAPWRATAFLSGIALIFAGAIYGFSRAQILVPRQINRKGFVWLDMIAEEFRSPLPDWPG